MNSLKNWLWVLLFGSLWGIHEVIGGQAMYDENVPYASVWLAAWAILVLSVARGVLNKPGSSTIIGIIAVLFRLVNSAPFICHLLGIFTLGLAFDVVSTALLGSRKKGFLLKGISGALSMYGGYALFAFGISYVVNYEHWVAGGIQKVIDHTFVSGSLAALLAFLVVPLGYWIGDRGSVVSEYRSRITYSGLLVVLAVLWTVGKLVG